MRRTTIFCLTIVLFFVLPLSLFAEEGMLPLSEIHKLDLKAKGLLIDPTEVYNPKGISLIDGIISLGGCTASFVSADGLIITNYHCGFRAVQSVTTKENDYFVEGFQAKDRAGEVRAMGYTVRITESYRDVSKDVLSAVKKKMSYAERTKAIEKKIKEIELDIEKKNPGKRADVSEMFIGKTYVLFIYTYIKDVRLVYAPPRAVGEFGGEIDNWMWPRHTGDFTFLRAYVAPDGKMADYSPDNVPYRPKRFLKIAEQGVKTGDFVFILGYPGRTNRHRSSHFISFEEEVYKPYVIDLYGKFISIMEEMSEKDRAVAIKLAPRTGGLWNTMKRYRGQLKGLKNIQIVKQRRKAEEALQTFIDSDKKRKKKYGTILDEIGTFYKEKREKAGYEMALRYFFFSYPLSTAYTLYEASIERKKKDTDRNSAYMDRNFDRTKQRLKLRMRNYYEPFEKIALKEMMMRAAKLEGEYKIPAVENIVKAGTGPQPIGHSGRLSKSKKSSHKNKILVHSNIEKAIDAFIEKVYGDTKLKDPDFAMSLFGKSTAELEKSNDPFIALAAALYPTMEKHEKDAKRQKGILDSLLSRLVDIKKQFLGKEFIPDANGTLRLTYGKIKGYSPADAVYYRPFTTVDGIIKKHTGEEPFIVPQKLMDLHKARDFGPFAHPKLNDVPVAMLYNMDTVGGNSGSPVLNAKGELVGLNFDRVFEATINDYAWDESYSRSIGVDVRFILWFTQKFGGSHLLKEINPTAWK